MNVTVVVSGLPNNAPLKELARNISKITDIKDVGAFRVREIPVDSDKRLVGLDFQDGFEAMDALLLLDGVKYKMGDGKQYMLKCRISKDAQHLPYYNDSSESYTVNDGRQSRNYEDGCYALVPYNETDIRNENAKLNAHLHLLEKKKKIVELERELLRAKKKLKKEYFSKTDSDSESEVDKCNKCPKASGRREIRSRERSLTPTKYHKSPSTPRKESKRKRKKKKRSPSTSQEESKSKRKKKKSKKSRSITRPSRSKSRTSRSRSTIVEYIFRSSESRSRSPSKALNVFRSCPKIYKSEQLSATVTSSSFRKESIKRSSSRWDSISRRSQSRTRRSQSRSRQSQSRARQSQSRPKRSQSRSRRSQSRSRRSRSRSWSSEFESKRLESEYSHSSRNCLITSNGARNAVTEIVNIKNYNKHIYLEKKYCKSNDTSTVSEQDLMRESAKRVEDAAYLVIREIDNLVDDEKQSLDKNDFEIVLSEFKNYVKTEFNKIKTELDKRMSLKEIVRFYRRRRSIEVDKAFLLKLIGELRESAKKVEDAAYLVIREIDNLVDAEKQSLDKNDVEIVLNEFKNYVKTEFNKIKKELDKRMSLKEIVRFYRRRRSIEEDKAFLLKLIGELIPKNAKDTVDEKKDDCTQRQRRRSIEMWNEVEEVLQEIPMDILQDIEDNAHEANSSSDPSSQNEETQININIHVSYARPTQENCAKVSDKSSSISTLKNTLKDNKNENVKNNEIQNEKNNIDSDRPENTEKENKKSSYNMGIKSKDNDDPSNVSETCCDTKAEKQNLTIDLTNDNSKAEKQNLTIDLTYDNTKAEKQNLTIDLTNDKNISEDNEVSKPHSNIVSKTNEKELSSVEICTNLPEKNVPQNPLFIIPVKRLMSQMKPHIKECENVHETIQTAIRARLVDLLKDKRNYLKTAQIITLYRSRYPKESDKLFFNEILENMNKELPTSIPIVE